MTRETVTLRVNRHERKVDTRIAVHHNRVHDIILVESDGKGGGERRDKAVKQQVHAVVVDIYILEDSVRRLLEGTRRKNIFYTKDTFLLEYFLLAVRLTLVVLFA